MGRYRVESGKIMSPAAGANWAYTFSQIEHVKLRSLISKFVTSATVATRNPELRILDLAGNIVFGTGDLTGEAATGTTSWQWSTAFASNFTNIGLGAGGFCNPFPDIWLPPSWSIALNTINIQTGDQWSQIAWAAEFCEDPYSDAAIAGGLARLG